MEDLGIIGALALELIKILKPEQRAIIQKKISELDEEYEKERQEILKAVESGDINTINRIIGKYHL